jgi:protein TonB
MASAIPAASAAGANADTGSNASSEQDAGAAGSSLVGGEPGQAGGFGVGSSGHGEAGVKAKKGVTRATPLGYGDNPAMPYPRTARRRGWQGEVLLRVSVSENGQVLSARVEKSSGYGILDDTALQQVSNWRFRPAQRNGIPRQDTVIVPVHFQLHAP